VSLAANCYGASMSTSTPRIAKDQVVAIRYTLTSQAGDVLDESGDSPLAYLHGYENIVPGLERQLEGKTLGDKLQAIVPPAEGYGERDPAGAQRVPRQAFPADVHIEEGMQFAAQGPDGHMIPMWVTDVEEDAIIVDLNHPLAGETLIFDVEVVALRAATAEELTHGHVHEPGGHHHH
jgi:FKBP-type peptidyl-prolyl cis-trans isomerase SlyD